MVMLLWYININEAARSHMSISKAGRRRIGYDPEETTAWPAAQVTAVDKSKVRPNAQGMASGHSSHVENRMCGGGGCSVCVHTSTMLSHTW